MPFKNSSSNFAAAQAVLAINGLGLPYLYDICVRGMGMLQLDSRRESGHR